MVLDLSQGTLRPLVDTFPKLKEMNEVNNNFMQYKHPCKNLIKMFNKKFDIFSFQNLTRVSLFEYKSV